MSHITTLEEAIEYVKENAWSIRNLSEEFQRNKQVALEAVKFHGVLLGYVHKDFRSDFEVVYEAVKRYNYALNDADENLKKNHDIVLAAIHYMPSSLSCAHVTLHVDYEFMLKAVKLDGECIRYGYPPFLLNRRMLFTALRYSLKPITPSYLLCRFLNDYKLCDWSLVTLWQVLV